MRLNYKARDPETIHYVDVMILYPYICKYFKFPSVSLSSMCETRAKTRKPSCVWMAS